MPVDIAMIGVMVKLYFYFLRSVERITWFSQLLIRRNLPSGYRRSAWQLSRARYRLHVKSSFTHAY